MTTTTTITLAVPTPFAVDPARLVAWLASHGWSHDAAFGDASGQWYTRGCHSVWLPTCALDPSYPRDLCRAMQTFANLDKVEPSALAALLAPPADGPALQWQHASPAVRAAAIARIADLAATDRQSVAILRADGCAEQALEAEGDALGLEAAAAWLRGGGER